MNIKACLSSEKMDWETPQTLFNELDDEFHFNLDPCSSDENAKCERHFTIREDGLKQKWFGNVFCNPPYGNEIGKWVKKCFDEIHDPEGEAESIVLLIPARTDTRYFHDYIYKKADEIRFIKGRLKFEVAGVAGGVHLFRQC